ncbi:sugar ABC transporter substrate-binding protein [Zhengella mangrovi]|uniref:sugar ABC transporter substrate-binding protein n=1 Tax=Zhengella mangrovi TaxID=1982044 RepID=UPI001FE18B1A|nr:sugar ABC transporter substrate-binding protein [Zhengella mangrovi]
MRILAMGVALLALPGVTVAKGIKEPLRDGYYQALKGKKVAFLPGAMAMDLAIGWLAGLKSELEPQGVEIVVRDPNFNIQAGAQALTQLIAEKPDVIVVHNPDVTTYAKLIKQAEANGILIVQINMASLQKSTAYVGVDWVEMGAVQARHVVEACKGKSGKIAIVQGDLTAAASAYTMSGIESVLAENPDIKVVSNQSASWQSDKAKSITQTVLKQNPDLCGIIGFWDNMDRGTAAAVDEAGLSDQVYVATSGGGETKAACDMVKSGAYDLNVVYSVPNQGANLASTIKYLLSAGVKPGEISGQMYTTLTPVTAANAGDEGICWTMKQ